MILGKFEKIMWKIIHYGNFFVCEKFHKQIPMKLLIFNLFFLHCSVCDTLLQIKNVLQLTIELLICALISQKQL